jgi:hypothetical protein
MEASKIKDIREFIDMYESSTNFHVYLAEADLIICHPNWKDEIVWIEVLATSSKFLFVDEWTTPYEDHKFNWVEDSSFLEKFMIIVVDNSGNINDSIMIGES